MMTMMRKAWRLVVAAAYGWLDDRGASMGAAIAFYTMFSIAPMLILVTAVAGMAFGQEAAEGAVFDQLRGLIGEEAAAALQAMIRNADRPQAGFRATVFGTVTLLVGATTVFAELQGSLNVVWKAPPPPESTLAWVVRVRLLSLSLIVAIGFLMLVSLLVNAAITAFSGYLERLMPDLVAAIRVADMVVSFALTTALFGLIYKVLPDKVLSWRDVLAGSMITALLFTIGKVLIGLYIGSTGVASAYGAAGALVVVLLWVYYSAQIFLFGAELTKAYLLDREGPPPPPSPR